MGAWGLGLFESDHDYDIIADLDGDLGLDKLSEDAQAKLRADEKTKAKPKGKGKDQKDSKKNEDPVEDRIYYSICPDMCSDPDLVRNHLQSTGKLDTLISTWTAKALGPRAKYDETADEFPEEDEWHNPGYKLVLIGACTMMMGCTLKQEFIDCLRNIFLEVGLMRDALKQTDTALNGPHGFKNGKPYFWGPFGVHEKTKNPDKDRLYPSSMLINVPSPGFGFFAKPDTSALENKIKARMELIKQQKPADVCGHCGGAEGNEGQALLTCTRCKERKYCGKLCQRNHWGTHKQLCAQDPGHPTNDSFVNTPGTAAAARGSEY